MSTNDRDGALFSVQETRRMLKGREDESFHISPATALHLVYETLDKAEAALSARENYEPPEGWQLKCEKCGADTTGPCGWPSDCPTGLGKHWLGR